MGKVYKVEVAKTSDASTKYAKSYTRSHNMVIKIQPQTLISLQEIEAQMEI